MFSLLDVDLIFFFKQKTAYEMRISDWSSDVCSSDLSHSNSDTRKVMLVVHSATERALRATISSGPRARKMKAAPTSGRKVTIESKGMLDIGSGSPAQCPNAVKKYVTSAATPISMAKA